MEVAFIAQPLPSQFGELLDERLCDSDIAQVTVVSAFASLQTVLRIKKPLLRVPDSEIRVRIVVGVDLGGTSKQVLRELASWPVAVYVFKNRTPAVTFHPKLYLIERGNRADIFVGSNNLTDGGFYRNYESTAHITYALPADAVEFSKAKDQLAKFLSPTASPVARRLDQEYLELLLQRADIPDEQEARRRRNESPIERNNVAQPAAFGYEQTPRPPRLPLELQTTIANSVRRQIDEISTKKKSIKKENESLGVTSKRRTNEKEPEIADLVPVAQVAPVSFFMELTTTQGSGKPIPGEQRIPLEALYMAAEFWGWKHKYKESISPRKGVGQGEDRVYLERKPVWRVRVEGDPAKTVVAGVRMYFYKNSSDFRFYSGALSNWATAGDIVRIERLDNREFEYDCTIALKGTTEHAAWRKLCVLTSPRSNRAFGFA